MNSGTCGTQRRLHASVADGGRGSVGGFRGEFLRGFIFERFAREVRAFFGAPKFRRKFPRTVFTVPRAFFGAIFGGQDLAPTVAPTFGRGRPLSNFGATCGAMFGAVLAHFWRQNLVTASARKQPRDPRSGLPEARGADAAVCNSSAIARHLAL